MGCNCDMTKTKISKLKKGDIFVKGHGATGFKREYEYDGKVRMYNIWGDFKGWGYEYTPLDDFLSGTKETFKDIDVTLL